MRDYSADVKGVTTGAASQMVRKLVEKGQVCFKEHQKYHAKTNDKWHQLLDRLDDESYDTLMQILAQVDKMLN